jgi:predicted N-formylglutamate amidohydrolase
VGRQRDLGTRTERRPLAAVVSCEHATFHVPRQLRTALADAADQLRTHRGWDAGASLLACELAHQLRAPLFEGAVTRLVCDLNRTPDHPRVFSPFTRKLPSATRSSLLTTYHRRHWQLVEDAVRQRLAGGLRVVHQAVHTFTPVLAGQVRTVDIGLLYDPAHRFERILVDAVQSELNSQLPALRVRRNQPYRGTSNSLPTDLRARLPRTRYAGIELEVNQRLVNDKVGFRSLAQQIARACKAVLQQG